MKGSLLHGTPQHAHRLARTHLRMPPCAPCAAPSLGFSLDANTKVMRQWLRLEYSLSACARVCLCCSALDMALSASEADLHGACVSPSTRNAPRSSFRTASGFPLSDPSRSVTASLYSSRQEAVTVNSASSDCCSMPW